MGWLDLRLNLRCTITPGERLGCRPSAEFGASSTGGGELRLRLRPTPHSFFSSSGMITLLASPPYLKPNGRSAPAFAAEFGFSPTAAGASVERKVLVSILVSV